MYMIETIYPFFVTRATKTQATVPQDNKTTKAWNIHRYKRKHQGNLQ